jgi:hypothetical protein
MVFHDDTTAASGLTIRQVLRSARAICSAASFAACVDTCSELLAQNASGDAYEGMDGALSPALHGLLAAFPDHCGHLSAEKHRAFICLLLEGPPFCILDVLSTHMSTVRPEPGLMSAVSSDRATADVALLCLDSRIHQGRLQPGTIARGANVRSADQCASQLACLAPCVLCVSDAGAQSVGWKSIAIW